MIRTHHLCSCDVFLALLSVFLKLKIGLLLILPMLGPFQVATSLGTIMLSQASCYSFTHTFPKASKSCKSRQTQPYATWATFSIKLPWNSPRIEKIVNFGTDIWWNLEDFIQYYSF